MCAMEVGLSLGGLYAPIMKTVEMARLAEEGGFSHVWVPDAQTIYRDVYEVLALCARSTDRVRLGPGVTNPVTRHPTVTASAICTLNEISKGRAVLGLGSGVSALGRIGMAQARLKGIEFFIQEVRKICVSGLRWASQRIPIYLVAMGPKTLRLSGKVCDGVIINVGASEKAVAFAVEQVKEGAEEAGRNPDEVVITTMPFITMSEDRGRAREEAKPYCVDYLLHFPHLAELCGIDKHTIEQAANTAEARFSKSDFIHTDRWDEAVKSCRFIPEEVVDSLIVYGTPEDCVRKIRGFERLGVQQFIVRHTASEAAWESFLRNFIQSVVPCFL